jgi:hypothetical protein
MKMNSATVIIPHNKNGYTMSHDDKVEFYSLMGKCLFGSATLLFLLIGIVYLISKFKK